MTKNTVRLLVVLSAFSFAASEVSAAEFLDKVGSAFRSCRRQTKARLVDPAVSATVVTYQKLTPPIIQDLVSYVAAHPKMAALGTASTIIAAVVIHEAIRRTYPEYRTAYCGEWIDGYTAPVKAFFADKVDALVAIELPSLLSVELPCLSAWFTPGDDGKPEINNAIIDAVAETITQTLSPTNRPTPEAVLNALASFSPAPTPS